MRVAQDRGLWMNPESTAPDFLHGKDDSVQRASKVPDFMQGAFLDPDFVQALAMAGAHARITEWVAFAREAFSCGAFQLWRNCKPRKTY